MTDHAHVLVDGGWIVPPSATGTWGRRIAANGSFQAIWSCSECDYVTSSIPHHLAERLSGTTVSDLRVVEDFRGLYAQCSVRGCDRDDVELQHWYPRAIDPEKAARYPQTYLCRTHHEEWGHEVTPLLNPPRRPGAA